MPEIDQAISHYRILEKIGVGGMGEVYLADDLSLDRKVALKFLPDVFTGDPERMARFEREAKLLASLNHPNIAAIYGLEQADGKRFLIMEYVEGETLQARISKGVLPVEDALGICRQIAEGLEAAHEKGVIHRDLKPANVMIAGEEKVKILDFGLAKASSDDSRSVDSSQSPTLTEAMTRPGAVLGTAAYMSPEQAKGKPLDKRTDVWAFGCVLYEMLTGKAAFQGEDATEILAAVVKLDADMDLLPADIHPRVREVLTRCLQKDPGKRYRDIGDVQLAIEQVLSDPGGASFQPVPAAVPITKLQQLSPWLAGLFGMIIVGAIVWNLRTPDPPRVMDFEYELPESQKFNLSPEGDISLAISPDGSRFVYGTTEGLYLRSLDTLEAKLIDGTEEDSTYPFFSPDGQRLGYFSRSDGKLKKIDIGGGVPRVLCDIGQNVSGASWDADGIIVYADTMDGDIKQVSAEGGIPKSLIKGSLVAGKKGILSAPQMLPDGKTLLFTTTYGQSDTESAQTVIQSTQSGDRKVLLESAAGARYLPSGHIVYLSQGDDAGNLSAVPFDLDKLEITGSSAAVIEGVRIAAYSDSGTLVYVPQSAIAALPFPQATLLWVDRQGKEEALGAPPDRYGHFRISPDGKQVALTVEPGLNSDIWIWDAAREIRMRLTFDSGTDGAPVWTPDGKRIVYFHVGGLMQGSMQTAMSGSIRGKAADGTGPFEELGPFATFTGAPYGWSKDGKTLLLAMRSARVNRGTDIGIMSMEGDHSRALLLQEEHNENCPRISPDGQWMAYQSDESGRYEIYVRPFPDVGSGGRWQVSTKGGDSPLWSPDGRELFYRSGSSFMAVDVQTEPAFRRGKPEVLFEGTDFVEEESLQIVLWDIHPVDKRFLMLKPGVGTDVEAASEAQREINIVLNWLEELKERVPIP